MLPGTMFHSSAGAEDHWFSVDRATLEKPDFQILLYLQLSCVTVTGLEIEAFSARQSCQAPLSPYRPAPSLYA